MTEQVSIDQTRAIAGTAISEPATRTRTINELAEEIGFIRTRGRLVVGDALETGRQAEGLHHVVMEEQLNMRAHSVARRSATSLLDQLAGKGFAWSDIARIVGVSIPGLRRWRQGESPSGANLLRIAHLVAFVETLSTDHIMFDPASWLEMPLTPDVPVTGIDLAADGRYVDLLDLAADQVAAEDVLDQWRPDWRDRFHSDVEVFEAADGEYGIRLVARDNE